MSFSDIQGQDKAIEIIRRGLQYSQLARSYLFTGPDGIGKKLVARTLAKSINCLGGCAIDSCDTCPSCLKIEKNQHVDVHCIDESGSESIKIEAIRTLQRDLSLRPYEGRRKVFIIDNAHNLTSEAANALLKILEEPPPDSLIILISSKISLLFKTIISRCQVLRFSPIQRTVIENLLKREYSLDEQRAHCIAHFSEGRLGYALRLKDTDLFASKNKIIDEFVLKRKSGMDNVQIQNKDDMRYALNTLVFWFRDMYLLKSGMPYEELANLDRKGDLSRAATRYSFDELEEAMNCVTDSLLYIEENINIKLLLSNLKWALK